MATERSLLLIADIGGYTNYMSTHRMSLAHAEVNTSRLLERVIALGDAAFAAVAPRIEPGWTEQRAAWEIETYVRTRESLIADQAEQLLELSTPVVKLWEGVVAVPLVGIDVGYPIPDGPPRVLIVVGA